MYKQQFLTLFIAKLKNNVLSQLLHLIINFPFSILKMITKIVFFKLVQYKKYTLNL